MIILGLDISSSTIGYGILSVTDKVSYVDSGFFHPPKLSIIENLSEVKDKILDIIEEYKPDQIAIEDIIMHMQSHSTAKTVITLAIYNRFIGHVVFEKTGKLPQFISVMSVRHKLKLTKVFPKKEEVPELLEHHLGIKFPYTYDKKNRVHKYSYDQADGIAVALTSAILATK